MAARKSFLLRLDPDTYEAVARWASDDLRSVNGQLEFLLRRALAEAGRLPDRRDRTEHSGGATMPSAADQGTTDGGAT